VTNFFTILAGVLIILGFIPNFVGILWDKLTVTESKWTPWLSRLNPTLKKTNPQKTSWIIWLSIDTITIIEMTVEHTLNGQIIGAVAAGWFFVAVVMKYGQSGWKLMDIVCFIGALLGIGLWIYFGSAVAGILANMAALLIGSVETFRSTWEDPSQENKIAWIIYWLSCVSTLLGVTSWTWAEAAQPITFFVIESTILTLIFIPRSNQAVEYR